MSGEAPGTRGQAVPVADGANSAGWERLPMHTPDVAAANIAHLAELFPSVVTEIRDDDGAITTGIDFDLLRQELADHVVEGPKERYGMDWPGKRQAMFAANAPIAKTLRPDRAESVEFDTTRNIFIEGDNLDALKLLQESYLGKVKLIYIDPPYNTGSDRFVYPDDYAENTADYLERSGQVDGETGARLVTNTESNGRFHSDWLSMMYPRLKLARNLLSDDGVVLVSIDDDEQGNLRALLDQIMGRDNLLAQLIWNKQHSQQQGVFKKYHEFILVYGRHANSVEYIAGGEGNIEAGALKKISRSNPASEFTFPAGTRFDAPDGTVLTGTFGDSEKVTVVKGVLEAKNSVTTQDVTLSAGWTQRNQMLSWFAGNETFDTRGQRVSQFYFNSAGKLKCSKERGRITPSTLLPEYGMGSEHSGALAVLMGGEYFTNPKPIPMLIDFIKWFTSKTDIVMDFFAGSAQMAEAVVTANLTDGGTREFIMIQLPEATPGELFETISDGAREHLRLAGEKIIDEAGPQGADLDVGFRAFTIDSTNMADTLLLPDATKQDELALLVESVKPGRSAEDLLFQVMLDTGLPLDLPISVEIIDGQTVHVVDNGGLIACFDRVVKKSVVEQIAEMAPEQAVFLDSAFRNDDERVNATQIFKERAPNTDVKTI